ncbi:MAG: type II toxin-antitoxin system mRNA interferase toxin, RelE/StbE family [Deltaproteobacteria bacterium]|nr:type II toxin-antitoxin system mRNA interferase toxin, RelE/StbE family [Deltaproteobacteria bacterium]
MMYKIIISKQAQKQVNKVPFYIKAKLLSWIDLVLIEGLETARQIHGYHDELLKGDRMGQRSIRLSKSYRAIYSISKGSQILLITIMGVTHHEY